MSRDSTGAPSIRQSKAKKRIRRLVIAYALRSAIILLLVLMEDCVIPNCFLQNTIQRGIFQSKL